MILIIDNYDSFVYNLVQCIGEVTPDIRVARNDRITLDEIESMAPDAIVISPGPGMPADAGICIDLVRRFADSIPMLGVCLGHQVIGAAFGARIIRADQPFHGKTSAVTHDGSDLFTGVPSPFEATRYHSLVVDSLDLPSCLRVTARLDNGTIMGLRHRDRPIDGVQFHPESILSPMGRTLIANFIRRDVLAAMSVDGTIGLGFVGILQ